MENYLIKDVANIVRGYLFVDGDEYRNQYNYCISDMNTNFARCLGIKFYRKTLCLNDLDINYLNLNTNGTTKGLLRSCKNHPYKQMILANL